jgi:hypothetical protein
MRHLLQFSKRETRIQDISNTYVPFPQLFAEGKSLKFDGIGMPRDKNKGLHGACRTNTEIVKSHLHTYSDVCTDALSSAALRRYTLTSAPKFPVRQLFMANVLQIDRVDSSSRRLSDLKLNENLVKNQAWKPWPNFLIVQRVLIKYSKILWNPKLLFQRENSLASFWVQRVLVTHQDPPG